MPKILEVKIYQKENNLSFLKLLKASFSDMFKARFLARQLATRDIKAQYRQSFLGIFWAFVTPLATALVWVILNNSGTIKLSATGIPYPVYAISGTLLWAIITEAINAPLLATNSAKGIMSKINFPKEALIISGIYKLLFNSAIKIFLLLVFLVFFGVGLKMSLLWFPLVILGALFFGTTIGLLITPLGMLYKDIAKIISLGLQFLMYVTPVVYAIPKEGVLKTIMLINPITPLITTARGVITGMETPHLEYFFGVVLVCIPIFFIGLVFYRISIPIIVERVSG